MTSILSPSTSWPTKQKPFSSKWLLSSGLTCTRTTQLKKKKKKTPSPQSSGEDVLRRQHTSKRCLCLSSTYLASPYSLPGKQNRYKHRADTTTHQHTGLNVNFKVCSYAIHCFLSWKWSVSSLASLFRPSDRSCVLACRSPADVQQDNLKVNVHFFVSLRLDHVWIENKLTTGCVDSGSNSVELASVCVTDKDMKSVILKGTVCRILSNI